MDAGRGFARGLFLVVADRFQEILMEPRPGGDSWQYFFNSLPMAPGSVHVQDRQFGQTHLLGQVPRLFKADPVQGQVQLLQAV